MGSCAKALPLAQQVLEVCKKARGENHPNYATGLNNLAALYWAMGDYDKALPLAQQALELTKKALGEGHPAYAPGLDNLAAMYPKRRDEKQPRTLCNR